MDPLPDIELSDDTSGDATKFVAEKGCLGAEDALHANTPIIISVSTEVWIEVINTP